MRFFSFSSLCAMEVFAFLALITFLQTSAYGEDEKVIYGDDNRLDVYELNDVRMTEMSRSTALLARQSELVDDPLDESQMRFIAPSFGEDMNLCRDERFYEQPTAGFCSGFLVSDDLVVTAGHCFGDEDDCRGLALVFDYAYATEDNDPMYVKKSNVYHCKEVVHRVLEHEPEIDFAIIKLDRKVKDRDPLRLRKEGRIKKGEPVTVIGHPNGLPTKVASGGVVRNSRKKTYFVTSLDSFHGNSGSAVINDETGEVEGILVRGERDYYFSEDECIRPNICKDDDCRGEDVTRTSQFIEYLNL